jgi:T5SS/PEP-CTERM-associated repeat protein
MIRLRFICCLLLMIPVFLVSAKELTLENGDDYVLNEAASHLYDLVYVGYTTSDNALTVSNGAVLNATNMVVGRYVASLTNRVMVGSGGRVELVASLQVGDDGAGNQLSILQGGYVSALYSHIGRDAVSFSNLVVVSGTDSRWENGGTGGIRVGLDGSFNTLRIEQGAAVLFCRDLMIGTRTGSNGNRLEVSGGARMYPHPNADRTRFIIGEAGNGNSMTVSSGARIVSTFIQVGHQNSYNQLTLSDSGTTWTNTDAMWIGKNGAHNRMQIVDGAVLVTAKGGNIGDDVADTASLSLSNRVEVAGDGSRWEVGELLINGGYAIGSSLSLADGGVVRAGQYTQTREGSIEFLCSWNVGKLQIDAGSSLDGRLELLLAAGYTPSAGSSYDLFDWGGAISGSFASYHLPALPDGLSWTLTNLYITGEIGITDAYLGEYLSWKSLYNLSDADGQEDADSDGVCNWDEFVAGTDPTLSTDLYPVTVSCSDQHWTFQWEPRSNRLYRVYWAQSLADAFEPIGEWRSYSQGAVTNQIDAAVSNGFFQLRVMMK